MKNRLSLLKIYLMLFLVLGTYLSLVGVAYFLIDDIVTQRIVIILPLVFVVTILSSWIYITVTMRHRHLEIRKSLDIYIEELMSSSGVGVLMYDVSGEIYWTSKFIESHLDKTIIGKKINTISTEFSNEFLSGKKQFRFSLGKMVFDVRVYSDSQIIVFKDVTSEAMMSILYIKEKPVLGEIEIDNYQQYQVVLPEEEVFKIQSFVIKTLDELVEQYGITYRQYVNGKYLLIANQEVLDHFILTEFDFLDKIRKTKMNGGMKLTISAGFGAGSTSQKELIDLAKEGLMQSQARGGDQVAIMERTKRPQYFGSKVEIAQITSRVKIKQIAEIIESRLSDPKIKNVIIYGHINADLDAVGSAMGMYDFTKAYGKEVVIQNATFDSTTSRAMKDARDNNNANLDMFVRTIKAQRLTTKDSTIVIIVDTAELDRIENRDALEGVNPQNVFILDHHRVSKLPRNIPNQNLYIDTSASSASEIVCELLKFTVKLIKPSKTSAQFLLNGIYLDTKQFTKSVSSRTFEAASWLESLGAISADAVAILKLPSEYSDKIKDVLLNVTEVRPGFFLTATNDELPLDIVSIIADEILRTQDRKAAFVIARLPGEKMYKMSARGIETNVQVIAEAVGGGGHFGAAAAVSSESLTTFVDNIKQAIISSKNDLPALKQDKQTYVFKGKI